MSGELKVDKISSSTNGEDVQLDCILKVNAISPDDELVINGSLKVLGTIMGTLDTFLPVGSIIPHDKSFPNMPALTGPFVECNGQTIEDTESIFNGYRTRNLNGDNVLLELTWTDDANGSFATVSDTDVTALSVGDSVSGLGIDSYTYIKEINGNTVVITDTDVDINDAVVLTTFTNDGDFIRGGLGSGIGQKDAFQGHWHKMLWSRQDRFTNGGGTVYDHYTAGTLSLSVLNEVTDSITDNANGEPRTANETRPANRTMVYIMRIK